MKVHEVMTADPVSCPADLTIAGAAQLMRDRDIGDVLVERNDSIVGIVTDRDIVVHGVAAGADTSTLTVGDICSPELRAVSPDAEVDEVVQMMMERALRRVPVVAGDTAIGIVSIGDLAVERDPGSALGQISASSPNN